MSGEQKEVRNISSGGSGAWLDERDLIAVRIAWDELVSYIETTGDEGSLDDEEMPDGKLRWAEQRLRKVLESAEVKDD